VLVGGCEDGDPDVLAGSGGEGDRATDDLLGLAGIDPEPEGCLDGLVELRRGEGLDEFERLTGLVGVVGVVSRRRVLVVLAAIGLVVLLGPSERLGVVLPSGFSSVVSAV
jgi:hypothetical protein